MMKTPISKTGLAALLLEELRCLDGAEEATSDAFYVVPDESFYFNWTVAVVLGAIRPDVTLHFTTVVIPAYQARFDLVPNDARA
jgi:hypothetical protein